MKITVAGLWHLGCVTSACCARFFDVIGFDEDKKVVDDLSAGSAPLFEPGLDELIGRGISTGKLAFTDDVEKACAEADLLWITYDTPVNEDDEADVESVLQSIRRCTRQLRPGGAVLISSQLPVGTCGLLEAEFPNMQFAYSPENLRLGKAIEVFENPGRIVVGTRDSSRPKAILEAVSPFCQNILWMRTESAEMVKHGLNSFLALSITFINEIAALCEQTGADAKEVSAGLKSDERIGAKAYLSAGGSFAGGTLARDIAILIKTADSKGVRLDVIPAVKRSNDWHRGWALRRLTEKLGDLKHKQIGLLGLAYKPGTSTLRRSSALEIAQTLASFGASVRAYDPAVRTFEHDEIRLMDKAQLVIEQSDALVICTEWPEFRQLSWPQAIGSMKRPLVLDANRFLEKELADTQAEYLSVGRT